MGYRQGIDAVDLEQLADPRMAEAIRTGAVGDMDRIRRQRVVVARTRDQLVHRRQRRCLAIAENEVPRDRVRRRAVVRPLDRTCICEYTFAI